MKQPYGSILNVLALTTSLIAVIVAAVILLLIALRGRRSLDNNLLLAANTYVPVLLCSSILTSLNINTRLGDLEIYVYPDSIACQVRGYLLLYSFHWLFITFALQALGRMFNVIYSQQHWSLRSLYMTKIFIMNAPVISLVLASPHIAIKSVVYEPEEFQCITNFRTWKNYTYMLPTMYLGPIAIVVASYARVIIAIRRSSLRISNRRHVSLTRDLLVLRRIVFIVNALVMLGLPTLIIWLQWLINGKLDQLAYRIQMVALSVSMLTLAIALALINPQVKAFLIIRNKNRVTTVVATIH